LKGPEMLAHIHSFAEDARRKISAEIRTMTNFQTDQHAE